MQVELGRKQEVVVYDQSSKEAGHLSKDGFVHILMGKLEGTFHKVSLLTGKTCVVLVVVQKKRGKSRLCISQSLFSFVCVYALLFIVARTGALLSLHSLISRCHS